MPRARPEFDAVVVGGGPNGLAAAITLARAGRTTLLLEAHERVGGGARTSELTLPGFRHDVCSAIHPLAPESQFLRELPLDRFGLQWIVPDRAVAHPVDGGEAIALSQDLERDLAAMGEDAATYRREIGRWLRGGAPLLKQILRPVRIPNRPWLLARIVRLGLQGAQPWANRFRTPLLRALVAGMAAHSILPLDRPATAAVALIFCLAAHRNGWPFPAGGSESLTHALADYFRALGGVIQTGTRVSRWSDLPPCRAVLLDTNPRQAADIVGDLLPARFRDRWRRFRHGPAAFKIDFALSAPVPWAANACRQAGTVHVGGSLEEIAESERVVWEGGVADQPYVIVAQHSLFDPSRAPPNAHTLWAYCHVPAGSSVDMSTPVEQQIERFAPGFRRLILRRHITTPAALQAYNANYVAGDITGGVMDWRQILFRPVARWDPYSTPDPRVYLCSASTPPGPGVHGLCGHFAARSALRRLRKQD